MAKGLLALLAPEKDDGDDEEIDVAQDALDAIKDDDAKALSLALSRHYELCASKHEDDEEY